MAKLDEKSSEVKTKKAKVVDGIVFTLLLIGAIAMVFPLIYMLLSSFMTKNQILSANFSIIQIHGSLVNMRKYYRNRNS